MIQIEVDGKQIAIPADALAREVINALPPWLHGGEARGQQGVIKSAIKNVLPMLLNMIHMDIRKRNAPIPPPDVRSLEARVDIIGYSLKYLITNLAAVAGQETYVAQGETRDGTFEVTGFVSRPPKLATEGEGERAAVAAGPSSAPTH